MLVLKLVQALIKTLHSEGTPGQVAAGIALGSILGLTPLLSPHNLLTVALIVVLNVSVPGALLGALLFVPVGFLLDPTFDWIGTRLLVETPAGTAGVRTAAESVAAAAGHTAAVRARGSVGWVTPGS